MRHDIYTPPSGPPQGSAPLLFPKMGRETLYQLSAAVYRNIGESDIASMFPEGEALLAASRKQAEFLIGILGGPPIYMEKYGHPRMRARHLPFEIDESARQTWLRCFREALGDGSEWRLSPEEAAALLNWLEAFSAWMVNQAPS